MPATDTLSAEHLLGENWSSERWYDTAEQRDKAHADMERQPPWYRSGDAPTVILEKIERGQD